MGALGVISRLFKNLGLAAFVTLLIEAIVFWVTYANYEYTCDFSGCGPLDYCYCVPRAELASDLAFGRAIMSAPVIFLLLVMGLYVVSYLRNRHE